MGSHAIAIMEFLNSSVSLSRIECRRSLHFVVIDLMAFKDTVKILKDLNDCFPFAKNDVQVIEGNLLSLSADFFCFLLMLTIIS